MDDLFVHPTINFGHIDIKNLSYSAITPNTQVLGVIPIQPEVQRSIT